MGSQIPEDFLEVTKSSTSHILEDGKTVVALCTKSGQLLELVDNKVTDCCDIDSLADDITVFTSYDPLQKYYLVRCQKQLVVVKRSRPMCVIQMYDDVVEVKIQDWLRIGRPQVVIRTQCDKEPIVTDFVGQLRATVPHVMPLLTASLSGKLQEMNARVAKVRRLLQEKQNIRYKALYRFTPHLQPPDCDTQTEPRVLVWGPPPPAQSPAADPPLLFSRPWRKVHNGKWIIGVPAFNATTSAVCDVRLRLRQSSAGATEPDLRYRSLVVGFGQRNTSGAQWTDPHHGGAVVERLREIAGRTTAIVVGVLEEPLFKKSSEVSISGSILYKQNSQSEGADLQDILGAEINLKVEDLIQGSLMPFAPQNTPDESDLVSVIVSSSIWQLCASPRHLMAPPLSGALERAGLVQVKELGCWVGPCVNGGALAGLVVIEAGTAGTGRGHTLHVYAREMKQALLFAHSLQGQWKVGVCKGSAATVQDCVTNLRAELCTLRSIARPAAEYTAEEWERIRDKLNGLELATDLSFTSQFSL